MNKRSFVEEAPGFYALAIAVALLETKQEVRTLSQLEISVADLSLDHRPLVEAGMRILEDANVAETIREAFGPPVYRRKPSLSWEWLYNTAGEEIPIFRRFAEIRNQVWLAEAISEVNASYDELDISPSDFEQELPSLWEPLPLDRSDEELRIVTVRVDEAIAQIERDNGYAANVPGERDYVLQSLKSFSSTLKQSAQITGMQIKTFALDPLATVMKRFAGNALGLVAAAAKDAIATWLKSKFGALIAWLLL